MNLAMQLGANGLVNGVLFALLAFSFGLAYRSIGIFHVAFGAVIVVAAYTFSLSANQFGLPWPAALGFGMAGGALASLISELAIYRLFYRRQASPGVVMVASLGFLLLVENLLAMGLGNRVPIVDRPLGAAFSIGPVTLTSTQVFQASIGGGVLVLVFLAFTRLRIFSVIRAMGDEPELVPLMGLPLMPYRTFVFLISGLVGGSAASLIALDTGAHAQMGMGFLLIAAVAMLAGGIDNYIGWILGGFVLALLQSLIVLYTASEWSGLATFALLIFILVVRPQGLLGQRKRLEEAAF